MATNGEINGHLNSSAPVEEVAPVMNGNGNVTETAPAPVAAPASTPLISTVRGPLGIESASLKGKIALVTGSGEED